MIISNLSAEVHIETDEIALLVGHFERNIAGFKTNPHFSPVENFLNGRFLGQFHVRTHGGHRKTDRDQHSQYTHNTLFHNALLTLVKIQWPGNAAAKRTRYIQPVFLTFSKNINYYHIHGKWQAIFW